MSDGPWSVGAAVRDLELVIDDEGRPLGERRSPSVVKEGVPIVLKACPYDDERRGIMMNVSALGQMTRHLDDVLTEVAGFHRGVLPAVVGWRDVFTVVVDQLAGPALHLLRGRDPGAPLPALRAVGHKLAEGYYGVVRALVALGAAGISRPVTPAALLDFVREGRALIGASEACAGPPVMIERVTTVLLRGQDGAAAPIPAWRSACARILSSQLCTAIAWERYDLETLRAVLVDEVGRDRMRAANPFMASLLDGHLSHVHDQPRPSARGFDYACLLSDQDSDLCEGLCHGAPAAARDDVAAVLRSLSDRNEGAVQFDDASLLHAFTLRMADYLVCYRRLVVALSRHELELRRQLGFSADAPIRFGAMALPRCRALEVLQAVVGHRLECEPSTAPALSMRNHRRSVQLRVEG